MPIYEYQCQDCDHRLEALQKLSDAPLQSCPECEQPRLKKLISAAGFRLKGSGWYETDFKTGNKKNLASSSDSGSKSSSNGDSGSKPSSNGDSGSKSSSNTDRASSAGK